MFCTMLPSVGLFFDHLATKELLLPLPNTIAEANLLKAPGGQAIHDCDCDCECDCDCPGKAIHDWSVGGREGICPEGEPVTSQGREYLSRNGPRGSSATRLSRIKAERTRARETTLVRGSHWPGARVYSRREALVGSGPLTGLQGRLPLRVAPAR
eukprot:1182022-Prorocentrum_minimum.AAC.1